MRDEPVKITGKLHDDDHWIRMSRSEEESEVRRICFRRHIAPPFQTHFTPNPQHSHTRPIIVFVNFSSPNEFLHETHRTIHHGHRESMHGASEASRYVATQQVDSESVRYSGRVIFSGRVERVGWEGRMREREQEWRWRFEMPICITLEDRWSWRRVGQVNIVTWQWN